MSKNKLSSSNIPPPTPKHVFHAVALILELLLSFSHILFPLSPPLFRPVYVNLGTCDGLSLEPLSPCPGPAGLCPSCTMESPRAGHLKSYSGDSNTQPGLKTAAPAKLHCLPHTTSTVHSFLCDWAPTLPSAQGDLPFSLQIRKCSSFFQASPKSHLLFGNFQIPPQSCCSTYP